MTQTLVLPVSLIIFWIKVKQAYASIKSNVVAIVNYAIFHIRLIVWSILGFFLEIFCFKEIGKIFILFLIFLDVRVDIS